MENEWKVIQNWVGHLFSATNDMHKKYFEDFPKNKKRFQAQNVTEATLTKKTNSIYVDVNTFYVITWSIFMYHKHL